jgi:acyl-CoA dehydrogenase
MATEIEICQAFVDQCVSDHVRGKDIMVAASMAKYKTSEMLGRVVDEGLQLFGGYGYMLEYPIARAFADARVQRIFGGTTEIMKEIIARQLVD